MMRNAWIITGLLWLSLAGPVAAREDAPANAGDVDFLDLAALMLRDGNLDRAIGALDQVDTQAEGTDLLRYHTLRGMAHLRRNEYAMAVDALDAATRAGAADSVVYVYLAQAYFSLERYRDVLTALDAAGPDLQRVPSVYHMRAQCHWLLAEHAMALAVLDQASRVFPEDPGFQRRKVFYLMDLGLYQEASDQGRLYLSRSEGRVDDFVGLGNAMRASGQLDEAARLLEMAKLRYPTDTNVKKVLANTYMDRQQLNSAADLVWEAALFDRSLTSEAAELYRRAGRPQRALMLNGEIGEQDVKLKQRLALYLETGQFARAASMEQSLKRVGLIGDEDIGYALAYAFFKIGEFESAEARLQELTRPDLFRKAAELRSAMQDCAEEPWQCL